MGVGKGERVDWMVRKFRVFTRAYLVALFLEGEGIVLSE